MKSATKLLQTGWAVLIVSCVFATAKNAAAVTLYWNTNGSAALWNSNNWGTDPSGPFTTGWTNLSDVDFGSNALPGWVTNLQIGNVTVHDGFNVRLTPTGTLSTGGASRIIDVGTGAVLDLSNQNISTAAGTAIVKNGDGIFYSGNGNVYPGGFTLNAGTVIMGGVNAMSGGPLKINGGTIAANSTRINSTITSITVGGDFTMGAVTTGVTSGNGSATANITLPGAMTLGGLTRTITVGSNGTYTFSGIVSNGGLIIDASSGASGRIILNNQNTYAGDTVIKTGATLSTTGASSTPTSGVVTSGPIGIGSLILDGGRYIPSSSGTTALANAITINDFNDMDGKPLASIAVGGTASTLSGNITGAGGFRKTSGGTLILTGSNNYTGKTLVESGTIAITKKQSFYNGNPGAWTDANFAVSAGANLVFAVGDVGNGEISLAEFLSLSTVGSATGGFLDNASIGIDTTNGGDQTIGTALTNTNMGMNRLGLVKSGTNTLFLTAPNTHGGVTTAFGGTLNLSHLSALQNSTLTTTTTGAVVFDAAAGGTNFTLGGLAGAGTLALQDTLGGQVNLIVGGNNESTASSAVISGAFGSNITKVGTGALTLTGANTYDGGTTVSAGRLNINHASAIGTGPLSINAGTTIDNSTSLPIELSNANPINFNGDFTFAGTRALNLGAGAVTMTGDTIITTSGTNSTSFALTISSAISGPGFSLTKSGPGRMFLSGQSDFSGGVTITEGPIHILDTSSNIEFGGTGPLGTGTLTLAGTTSPNAQLIGSSTDGGPITTLENNIELIGAPDFNTITTNATLVLTGVISGSGGFTRGGNGMITLANANTFSGNTNAGDVGAGRVLKLKNELAVQNSTVVTALGAADIHFDGEVVGNAFTLGGLAGDQNIALTDTFAVPVTVSIGNNNSSTTYSGNLSGAGSIKKIGTGSLALNGENTHTGTTTVDAGTLLVNGTHTGGGAYSVKSGATLGGTGFIHAAVDVESGGAVAPGASIESLDIDSLTLASGTQLNFELGAPSMSDLINVTVADGFIANGGTFNFTNAGGLATGTYTLIDYAGTLGGAFGNLGLGMTQPSGFSFMLVDNAGNTSIDLQVTATSLPGDFNGDGDVDAADYVLWRKNPGSFLPATYNTWRANFGNSSGSGTGLGEAPVPEPAAGILVILAAMAGCIGRRQRQS